MPQSFFARLARRYEPPSALDRRHFLQLTLAASAGLLLSGSDALAKRPRGRRGTQRGNQRLALKFAQALGQRLRLKTPVTRVEAKEDQATVHCATGETLTADDVVLAVPPSVWPRIRFEPELPQELRPQMGPVVKYLSVVDRRFWESERLGPHAVTDGMVSVTWEATGGQPGPGAVLTAFSGGPAATVCRRRWAQDRDRAYRDALEALYPHFGHRGGPTARRA